MNNIIHQVGKLIQNGLRYRFLKLLGKPHRLESISLELTHRCICRCQMCNIWKIPNTVPDLELPVWLDLLSSPALRHLKELDLTGGEPFLRKDLGDLLLGICTLKPNQFPGLRTVSITTNGILTDRVLKVVQDCIGPLAEHDIDLVFACGMDAAGETHDKVRQFPGAWEKLQKTLAGLQQIRDNHPNLILGLKTTIVPQNVDELEGIADFAEANGLFTIISPCIITPNRFGNLDLEGDLKFSSADIQKLIQFYQGPRFRWSGHREAMLGYLQTGTIKKPCSASYNTLFVRHNGEVFGCPIMAKSLGNIQEQPLADIFRGPVADRFRKQVGSYGTCASCTEPGLERIAWTLEGFTLLRLLTRNSGRDYQQLV
ncbi:MAG: radical SAM protein, partial [Desulfuromonadaceae bacterium]